MRHVRPHEVLSTRFDLVADGANDAPVFGGAIGQLFEAYIGAADAPTLHDAQELELQLDGLTTAGERLLAADAASQALLVASHAIRGWACFAAEGTHLAADAVRLSLRRFVPGRDALSRGSAAAAAARPLVALLDLRRRLALSLIHI